MRKSDLKWLRLIVMSTNSASGMYPGRRIDLVPDGPANRLRRAGLIDTYIPHNPAHHERWVATSAAKAAIEEAEAAE